VNKKSLTELDICSKFITPAIVRAGWDLMSQIREQLHLTKGRIIVRGKLVTRGKANFTDCVLYHKPNFPLASIKTFPQLLAYLRDEMGWPIDRTAVFYAAVPPASSRHEEYRTGA
jgi:hypothetical protein